MKPAKPLNDEGTQSDKQKGIASKTEQEEARKRLLRKDEATPNPTFPHTANEEEEDPKPLKLKPDDEDQPEG